MRVVIRPPTHFRVRAIEMLVALIETTWGAMLAFGPGDMLAKPQFHELLTIAPQPVWAAIVLTVGAARIAAILRNGAWRRSPYVRMWASGFSFMFWLEVNLNFLHSGVPTLALAAVPWFCLADLYSVGVAAFDAGHLRGVTKRALAMSA